MKCKRIVKARTRFRYSHAFCESLCNYQEFVARKSHINGELQCERFAGGGEKAGEKVGQMTKSFAPSCSLRIELPVAGLRIARIEYIFLAADGSYFGSKICHFLTLLAPFLLTKVVQLVTLRLPHRLYSKA